MVVDRLGNSKVAKNKNFYLGQAQRTVIFDDLNTSQL
jgi:hypothetical protein